MLLNNNTIIKYEVVYNTGYNIVYILYILYIHLIITVYK